MVESDDPAGRFGKYVRANGLHLYYEEFGSGKALVCLHGALGTGSVWRPYIPDFSEHFHLVLPDARGHGKTENPSGTIDLQLMAGDTAALIEVLNLDQPILCGWSMGGDVGLEVARRYPDKVGGLIVGGVTHRLSDAYLASLQAIGLEGPGRINFERAQQNIPQLIEQWKAEHAQKPDHWKELALALSAEMWDPRLPSEEELKHIAVPTLIVWGDRDQFLPVEDAVALYRLIPNAQLAVVPGADHFVSRTQVGLFARLVLDFGLSLS